MLIGFLIALLASGVLTIALARGTGLPQIDPGAGRAAAFVWGLRVLAAAVVSVAAFFARPGGGGIWLDDEASYHLSTVFLLPGFFNKLLPNGLDHLGGSSYLGLTVPLYALFGTNPPVLRLANATLGILVALTCMDVAATIFGPRRAWVAAVLVGIWPALIFWSSLILRDTLISLAVVTVWWSAIRWDRGDRLRAICAAGLSLALLEMLRPYIAGLAALGLAAWALYPLARRIGAVWSAGVVVAAAGCAAAFLLLRPASVQQEVHTLAFRQVTTRLETLHKLYIRPPQPIPAGWEFPVSELVVLRSTDGGDVRAGEVEQRPSQFQAVVTFTDGSTQTVPTSNLEAFQNAHIPPVWILRNYGHDVLDVLTGQAPAGEDARTRLAWLLNGLAEDLALVGALVAIGWRRLSPRAWLYPLIVAFGTVAVLAMVPGAVGNAARHRDGQTVPLLLALAAGAWPLVEGWRRRSVVAKVSTTATSAAPPAASRSRSAS